MGLHLGLNSLKQSLQEEGTSAEDGCSSLVHMRMHAGPELGSASIPAGAGLKRVYACKGWATLTYACACRGGARLIYACSHTRMHIPAGPGLGWTRADADACRPWARLKHAYLQELG